MAHIFVNIILHDYSELFALMYADNISVQNSDSLVTDTSFRHICAI